MRRTTSRTSTVPTAFRFQRATQADADQADRAGRAGAAIVVPADVGGAVDAGPAAAAVVDRRAAAEIANTWPSRWNVADGMQNGTTAGPDSPRASPLSLWGAFAARNRGWCAAEILLTRFTVGEVHF